MENYKNLVIEAFRFIVEDLNYNPSMIEKYFSKDYNQRVDGQELNFYGFCQHMKVQKEALKNISVNFKTIVQENEIVFTNHIITLRTKDERHAEIQVIAEFHIHKEKIIYCDELTHLLHGDDRERDFGSRH